MKHFIFSLLLGLALIGCTSEEALQQWDSNQETAKEAVLTVINNPQQIGANELAEYACKVLSNSGAKSRAQSASTVTEVYSDKNGSGIYAVNFGENDGFVLLTTQQKMHPVVAMSETGHFDVSKIEGSPIQLWLKDVELAISHPEEIPDSVVLAAKLEWNKLNSTEVSLSAQSRSIEDENIYNTINLAINQWCEEGYSVTRVSDATADNYPSSIRDAINNIKKYHSGDPDIAETSFILIKTTQTIGLYFPEIKTKWHQGFPYNSELVYNGYSVTDLGCVTLAVAQIMNYHKNPQSIDFSQLPNETSTVNTYLSNFLIGVGNACGIDYHSNSSGSNIDKAKKAFAHYGYSCDKINYDRGKILSSLIDKNPVYMRGDVSGESVGHAWVCDGSRGGSDDTHYMVKSYTGDFADIDPTAAFGTIASETVCAAISPTLHMVWGWNTGDGWYAGTDWTIRTSYSSTRIVNNIKALVNIKPN